MKTAIRLAGLMILGVGLLAGGCLATSSKSWESIKDPRVVAQLKSFVTEKESQENKLVSADEKDYAWVNPRTKPPDFRPFFSAASQGDWPTLSNLWAEMEGQASKSGKDTNQFPHGMWLQPVREVGGAIKAFVFADGRYAKIYGDDIIRSLPPRSIYFGGSDPGRFVVTAMCKSQVNGDPFFVLTQNQMVDGSYREYLRSMYGQKIYIPTGEDLQKCVQDYTEDVKTRLQNHRLKPGENVTMDSNGQVQFRGVVAVMEINGLIVKAIFDKNPDHQFYIQENYPFDWAYSYLEPHGLIFKLNRQPLSELSDEIVRRDHDYWTNCIAPMIGGWLNDDTTIGEIAAFTEKVFARRDLRGFDGDPRFLRDGYWHATFSAERCAIADLYAWRAEHAVNNSEKKRMQDAADFAFRQGWALCPDSPTAIYRYVQLLTNERRISDSILVVKTALKMPQMEEYDARQVRDLLKSLEQMQQPRPVK